MPLPKLPTQSALRLTTALLNSHTLQCITHIVCTRPRGHAILTQPDARAGHTRGLLSANIDGMNWTHDINRHEPRHNTNRRDKTRTPPQHKTRQDTNPATAPQDTTISLSICHGLIHSMTLHAHYFKESSKAHILSAHCW